MTSVTVDVDGTTYDAYISLDDADAYLKADMSRSSLWLGLSDDDKGRAIVTATRLLQRQSWVAGTPPSTEAPVLEPVPEATALLAADIAAKPAAGDGGSTGSNVKSVGAGSAKVEFFRPTSGPPLSQAAWDLLSGLLGDAPGTGSSDGVFNGTAYGSHDWQRSRFNPTEFTLIGDGDPRIEWPLP